MSNLRSKEKSGCVISLARPCPRPRSSSRVSASHPRVHRAHRPPRATPLFSLHRIHRSTPASRVRARPPPSHRARPITPRVSRGHPPSRARVIIHRPRRRRRRRTRRTRRANTRVYTPPRPLPSRASHRIERDAPTTPRARVMRCDARPADGSDEWPRRGDRGEGLTTSHDRSRSRARTARAGIRSVDRAIDGVPCLDRCPGTTKNGQLSHT